MRQSEDDRNQLGGPPAHETYLRDGTTLIRLSSNHFSGRFIASSLTLVGAMRVSIGPAISVRLLG